MNHGVLIKVSGANQGSVFVLLHGWPIDLPIPYYLLFMAALHMIGKRPIHPSEAPASPTRFQRYPHNTLNIHVVPITDARCRPFLHGNVQHHFPTEKL